MDKPSRIVPFVLGLAPGIIGTIFLPGYVRPYLPHWAAGKEIIVTGTVAAKEKKRTFFLLTVDTPGGALPATFRKKVDEINLLAGEKDAVEFILPQYTPFVDEPKIIRVVKGRQPAPGPAPEAAPAQTNGNEAAPPREKAPAAPGL